MTQAVYAFPDCEEPARRFAARLGAAFEMIDLHRFPDGESLVRVRNQSPHAIIYRSLNDPNQKIFELILAASALREGGANRITLVAPYLAYMRQDMEFNPGEAVSQLVIGKLLADHFDGLITIDAHLHRVSSLTEVFPTIPAINLSAAPLLAEAIVARGPATIIGPDSESRQWVETIAEITQFPFLIGEKDRHGDRAVEVAVPGITSVAGRPVALVDDVVSSGSTLIEAAQFALTAGASRVDAYVTHSLARDSDLQRMREAGIDSLTATDTIPCKASSMPIAALMASAIGRLTT